MKFNYWIQLEFERVKIFDRELRIMDKKCNSVIEWCNEMYYADKSDVLATENCKLIM